MTNNNTSPKTALMLSGGGARAAYQVGVLKAIAAEYSRNCVLPFPILCGTSAGSINATALACYAGRFHLAVKKLEWVWKNFRSHQVYHADTVRVFGHMLRRLLSLAKSDFADHKPASLLNSAPLRSLLKQVIDFKRIDRNVQREVVEAIAITASCYTDGDSISFFQGKENHKEWQRARRKGTRAHLTTEHLMASAAIPLVFPSVQVEQKFYGDGSVHQLSPLSPAVHLGAEQIFVICVDRPGSDKYNLTQAHHPSAATIATHLFDTIFTDTLNSDIERLQRINNTVSTVNQQVMNDDGVPLRKIDCFLMQPSHDFDKVAQHYYRDLPFAIRMLLRTIGVDEHSESSLTSYLLFEQTYTTELIRLGFEDAQERMPEITAFLAGK